MEILVFIGVICMCVTAIRFCVGLMVTFSSKAHWLTKVASLLELVCYIIAVYVLIVKYYNL